MEERLSPYEAGLACDADGARRILAIADEKRERLDVFAARASGETRAFVQRLIEEGAVTINGVQGRSNARLKPGDAVEIHIKAPVPTEILPEDIPLSIVYEDSDIAVIDKPKGMVVHPAPGNERGTLVNAILYHIKDLSGIGGALRPGIVHRIDKMTSGLIVIAKNDFAHRALAEQMKTHAAGRIYIALVDGNIKEEMGTVDAPVGRHPTDRKRMAVVYASRRPAGNWQNASSSRAYGLSQASRFGRRGLWPGKKPPWTGWTSIACISADADASAHRRKDEVPSTAPFILPSSTAEGGAA